MQLCEARPWNGQLVVDRRKHASLPYERSPLRLSSALPFSESDKDTSAEYYPPDCRGAPLYINPSHTAHTHTCTHAHTPSWFSSTLPVFSISFLPPMHRSFKPIFLIISSFASYLFSAYFLFFTHISCLQAWRPRIVLAHPNLSSTHPDNHLLLLQELLYLWHFVEKQNKTNIFPPLSSLFELS